MNIGSLQLTNNLLLAPMAGITDLPYRMIMKRFGAGLVFTEMISANGLVRNGRGTISLLRSLDEERPLGVQLFGDDPQVLAEAAARVNETADLVDLNLGCPVRKVTRSGAGSALLCDLSKTARILEEMRRAITVPFTVKIRSGWDQGQLVFLELGRIAEEAGVDAIVFHPRTRAQGFGGRAEWEQIRRLKESVKIPVCGSGDIFSVEDGFRMLEETGCDAIMIGRGGFGNPWLLGNLADRLRGRPATEPTPETRLSVALAHLDLHLDQFGPAKTLFHMRKHFSWYSRGLPDAAGFRAAINRLTTIGDLRRAAETYFLSVGSPPALAS